MYQFYLGGLGVVMLISFLYGLVSGIIDFDDFGILLAEILILIIMSGMLYSITVGSLALIYINWF